MGKNVKIAKLYRGEFGQRGHGWVEPKEDENDEDSAELKDFRKKFSKRIEKVKKVDFPRPSLEHKILRGDYNSIMR